MERRRQDTSTLRELQKLVLKTMSDADRDEERSGFWLSTVTGLIILLGGVVLLAWNEHRAVTIEASVSDALKRIRTMATNEIPSDTTDLIHVSGKLRIAEPLSDPYYGISVQAVKLKRRIQMYQWVEYDRGEFFSKYYEDRKHMFDVEFATNNTNYYYVKEWRDKIVNSTEFHEADRHTNLKQIPYQSRVSFAQTVQIDRLTIGPQIKGEKFYQFHEFSGDGQPESDGTVKLHMGMYYHCEDVWHPKLGDVRVQFYYTGLTGEVMTIVAGYDREKHELVPYIDVFGQEMALVREGRHLPVDMYNMEHHDARVLMWIFRAYGHFLIMLAVMCAHTFWARLYGRMRALFGHKEVKKPHGFRRYTVTPAVMPTSFLITFLIVTISWISYRPLVVVLLIYCVVVIGNGLWK